MNHPHLPALQHHSRRKNRSLKALLLLPAAGILLALNSCKDENATKPVQHVTVTDTKPVGEGLAVIGFAIVGATVVFVLGRLLR